MGTGEWRCEHTGDRYVLDGVTLLRFPGPQDILKYTFGQKLERMKSED